MDTLYILLYICCIYVVNIHVVNIYLLIAYVVNKCFQLHENHVGAVTNQMFERLS